MEELSLHILDVAENGVIAGAGRIKIEIEEDEEQDRLAILIEDNGRGMDPEFLSRVLDPFVTTRTTRRVGLGLSLFQQTAQEAEGSLEIDSEIGRGTRTTAVMSLGHIDRKPMGDLAATIVTLIEGNPDVDFEYRHVKNGKKFELSTSEIREELEEVPINSPEVVRFIHEALISGLDEIGASN
jgi:anti-sigma regulatory factor (Ser/Thr protein kinase)